MLKFNKNPCSFYHFILNPKHGRLNNGPKDVRILIPKYVTLSLYVTKETLFCDFVQGIELKRIARIIQEDPIHVRAWTQSQRRGRGDRSRI